MALDPRTLTPAAARSMFLRNQTGLPGPRKEFLPATGSQTGQLFQPAPLLEQRAMQPSLSIEDLISGEGTSEEKETALKIGKKQLGPTLEDADPAKLMTLATDDESKVDPS